MKINLRFLPMLGLAVSVGTALFVPENVLGRNYALRDRFNALQNNFRISWPIIIGAPLGTSLAGALAKGFGNPGVSIGPLSLKTF